MTNYIILGKSLPNINSSILKQFILFTYVENFPPIHKNFTHITDDVGWGCTIRCGQMMLYIILKQNLPNIDPPSLISYFNDSPQSILSIHNIVQKGNNLLNIKIGNYYGSHSLINVLSLIFNQTIHSSNLIILHYDSNIIKKDILDHLNQNKKIILCLSLKFGNNGLNTKHFAIIQNLLSHPNNYGFIGGENNSSYYFVGYNQNKFLYLDPHTINNYSPNPNIFFNNHKLKNFKQIHYSKLSESITFSYVLTNHDDLHDLLLLLQKNNEILHFINILDEKIYYKDLSLTSDESWEILN